MRIVDDDVSWTAISTTNPEKEEEDDGDLPVVCILKSPGLYNDCSSSVPPPRADLVCEGKVEHQELFTWSCMMPAWTLSSRLSGENVLVLSVHLLG